MNKFIIFVIIFIIFAFLLFFFKNINFNEKYEQINNFDNILSKFIYYNEKNEKINHFDNEIEEQRDALEFIDQNDIVLELGGRYGTVSNAISYKQKNSGKLVVVEPDTTIINALTNNRNLNKTNYIILNKYISNNVKKFVNSGYGSMIINSDAKSDPLQISYLDFKKQYPLKFNVLVADCEGCLGEFLDILGDDINNYNKILFEADQSQICNYDNILLKLNNLGFKIVKKKFNEVNRFVLIK